MITIILMAILLGIVEGITEWLPVSSTGHLIIFENLFNPNDYFIKEGISDYGSQFFSMFEVVIQFAAIIAVIIFFFSKLWPFSKKDPDKEISKAKNKDIWLTWLKVLIACIPAAVIGLLLDDFLDKYLYNTLTVSITLIIYGVIFILMEIWNKKRNFTTTSIKEMTIKQVLIIGLIQCLALIPGTSRSGVTILGAMLLLCNRESSAEFSFFLSIPVMLGASLLKILKFFMNYGMIGTNEIIFIVLGCLVSFIISFFAVKWLMGFVKKHSFKPFGYYRIALGIILLILFIVGVLK